MKLGRYASSSTFKELKPVTIYEGATMAEFQLPDAIIQHIQSFLIRRDAARTSILSRSWYTAWSTRPILDFDERDFGGAQNGAVSDEFVGYVQRILQRYKELNLKVDYFALRMKVNDDGSASLANELILDVLKLGVNEVNLEFFSLQYVLPVQLFTASSLTKLSLFGCIIDWRDDGRVMCSKLAWLSLYQVRIRDEMLRDIILGCPLIDSFFVSECEGLTRINLGTMPKLKQFTVDQTVSSEFQQPLTVDFIDRGNGSSIYNRVHVPEFRYLDSLVLKSVKIDDVFFSELLYKFPHLKVLQIAYCDVNENVQISSSSLKSMTFMQLTLKKIHFDVPSICEITFSSQNIPSLSISNYPKDWESTIILPCWYDIEASWFSKLREFLIELRHSKVSLLIMYSPSSRLLPLQHVMSFPIPVVENLKIYSLSMSSSMLSALLGGLFSSCRPKFVIRDCTLFEDLELLYNTLRQQAYQNRPSSSWNLLEVNVEFVEATVLQWKPIPWQAVSDVWKSIKEGKKFRFQLQWGDNF